MTVHPLSPAEELQRLFLQLKVPSFSVRQSVISEILEHPLTQEKLRAACGAVMKRWARRRDLQADVLQEAICQFVRWLKDGRLEYADCGPERLGGWLWTVWQNACREAWRRCRPVWLREMALAEWEMLEEIPERDRQNPVWETLLEEIEELSDDGLRRVMLEWSAGWTGKESAQHHGLSEATVSRLRCSGLERLRMRLSPVAAPSWGCEFSSSMVTAIH